MCLKRGLKMDSPVLLAMKRTWYFDSAGQRGENGQKQHETSFPTPLPIFTLFFFGESDFSQEIFGDRLPGTCGLVGLSIMAPQLVLLWVLRFSMLVAG